MVGKVVFKNRKEGVFVQRDKNFQVCDLLSFDRKKKVIGNRVYPDLLNIFRGQPLYTAWNSLLEAIKQKEEEENKGGEING